MKKPNELPEVTAVRFLGAADRTEAELRQHLERKAVPPADIERVVEWAKAKKYVSDVRVAQRETEIAKSVKLVGRAKTKSRLIKRGANEALVDEAVRHYSEAEEEANALVLVQKRFAPSDDPAKIARFLLGRGFEEDTVRRTLSAYVPGFEW